MSNLSKRSIRPRANTVNPPAKKSLAFVWPASASVTPLCAADCPRASPVRRVVSECLQEREQRIGGLAAARAHGSERACDLAGVRAAFVRWLGACGVRGEEPASALVGLADRIATDVSQCAAAETGSATTRGRRCRKMLNPAVGPRLMRRSERQRAEPDGSRLDVESAMNARGCYGEAMGTSSCQC